MKQLDALGPEPVADVDAWFDGLTPEERAILSENGAPDLGVVPRWRYTEPHDAAKREAAKRVRQYGAEENEEDAVSPGDNLHGVLGVLPDDDTHDVAVDGAGESLRDAIHEAFAAGRAHAAAEAAAPGVKINVVITFADAARTFASHSLRALARRLRNLADRVEPNR